MKIEFTLSKNDLIGMIQSTLVKAAGNAKVDKIEANVTLPDSTDKQNFDSVIFSLEVENGSNFTQCNTNQYR